MKTKIILTVLSVMLSFGFMNAQNQNGNQKQGTKTSQNYVDKNKNGICDHKENGDSLKHKNKKGKKHKKGNKKHNGKNCNYNQGNRGAK